MNATAHIVAPEEIMAFLDGELSAAEAQAVSAHLDHCTECASLAKELRLTSQSLARWSVEPMPPRLEASIKELAAKAGNGRAVRRPRAYAHSNLWSPRNWRFWAIGSGGVVAAVLVLAISLSTSHRRDRQFSMNSSADSFHAVNGALDSNEGALADRVVMEPRTLRQDKVSGKRKATTMAQVSSSVAGPRGWDYGRATRTATASARPHDCA